MSLKGDVIVVTGASQGIGLEIADRCATEGARIVITGRTGLTLKAAEKQLSKRTEVLAVLADAEQEAEVQRLQDEVLSRFGQIDGLVNNAGGAEAIPFLKTTRADWNRMFSLNATSAFLASRAFIPGMLEKGSGRIVVIASQSSKKGAAYVAAYTAAKHAVLGLVRSLAAEFGEKGIKVNAICPGYVDTPMTRRSIDNIVKKTKRTESEARKALESMNPQKRFIQPAEVADVCVKLLDKDCPHQGEALDL